MRKRSKENNACKNAREAEKDKARNYLAACSFKSYKDKIVNTGKGRGRRSRNETVTFPSQDAQSQINSRLAWVDNHPTAPAGISPGEESLKPREDYKHNMK